VLGRHAHPCSGRCATGSAAACRSRTIATPAGLPSLRRSCWRSSCGTPVSCYGWRARRSVAGDAPAGRDLWTGCSGRWVSRTSRWATSRCCMKRGRRDLTAHLELRPRSTTAANSASTPTCCSAGRPSEPTTATCAVLGALRSPRRGSPAPGSHPLMGLEGAGNLQVLPSGNPPGSQVSLPADHHRKNGGRPCMSSGAVGSPRNTCHGGAPGTPSRH